MTHTMPKTVKQVNACFNLKTAEGVSLAAQSFESESLAEPALAGEHSHVGKAPAGASDSGSKDCADRASPTAVFRFRVRFQQRVESPRQ